MGGGTSKPLNNFNKQAGLSPRGRGNPSRAAVASPRTGPIPAWAGEPLRQKVAVGIGEPDRTKLSRSFEAVKERISRCQAKGDLSRDFRVGKGPVRRP